MSAPADWTNWNMALTRIKGHFDDGRTLAQARAAFLHAPKVQVVLPAFHILEQGELFHAWDFCAPDVRKDISEIFAVYEEYVDRPLHRVARPERPLYQLASDSVMHRYLDGPRKQGHWWCPLIKLLAIAAKLSKAIPEVRDHKIVLDVGGFLMDVRPRRVWCNTRQTWKAYEREALDSDLYHMVVPALRTDHPLAQVVTSKTASKEMRWAANVAIRAEMSGRIKPITHTLFDDPKPRDWKRKPRRPAMLTPEQLKDRVATITHVIGMIQDGSPRGEIKAALVPYVISLSEYHRRVADERSSSEGPLTEKAAASVIAWLEEQIEEATERAIKV